MMNASSVGFSRKSKSWKMDFDTGVGMAALSMTPRNALQVVASFGMCAIGERQRKIAYKQRRKKEVLKRVGST